MDKKVLVTGAAGYIGSHLVKALYNNGFTVHGIDNNWNQNDINEYCETFFWDLTTEIIPDGLLTHYDAIVHLASETMVSRSVAEPYTYYLTNITGTHNLLKYVKTDHLIYGSTGSAFNPGSSPYSTSKRASEDVVVASGTPYSICRFYNVSGNDGFDKFDPTYYHLIRKAAAVATGKFDKIQIYGSDFDTPDGTAIRNYTHVKDIVSAVMKIVYHGATYNIECLGNTKGYSVKQVIDTMNSLLENKLIVEVSDKRVGDVDVSVLPNQSKFFTENHTLLDQCSSALEMANDS